MAATLVGKCLGFIREMTMAGFFGTSYIVDAYVMANSIPGILLGGVFAAIGAAYMPTFSEITENDGEAAGRKFTHRILSLCGVISIVSIVIGVLLSDRLVAVFAPKFNEQTSELASFYLKITFAYSFFACGISILSAYLRYNGIFIRQIIGGYFFDFGVILGIVICGLTNRYFLPVGYVLGYVMYFLIVAFATGKQGYRFRIDFSFGEPVRHIIALAIPVFLGSAVDQVNTFVDKTLASGLSEGSIAALTYGSLVTRLIISLTAAAIVTALYPKLTRAVSRADWTYFNAASGKSLLVSFMIGIPFCLGSLIFAEPVIQAIFERGAFSEASTDLTSQAFFYYSIGIPFMAFNVIIVQIFYAMRDMKTPIIASLASVAVNVILNLMLVGPMQHRGLALATSVANIVNMIALCILMRKKHPEVSIFPEAKKIGKILLASVVSVGIAVPVYHLLQLFIYIRILQLIPAVGAACILYIAVLRVLKVEELKILLELIPGAKK